ncbi:MAG TPA: hypothetical protein VIY73_17905 [Polyangiaceae bacterium]
MNSAWAPFGVLCALALGRALLAHPHEQPAPLDTAQRHEAFHFVASDEPNERREAAKTVPTDVWSRDDDFHQREGSRARDWANSHHARLADVLLAIDEGLRDGWPSGSTQPLVATVPPCRPRAIY